MLAFKKEIILGSIYSVTCQADIIHVEIAHPLINDTHDYIHVI